MMLIVDINRTGQGLVEISADPLVWTLESIRQTSQ
jgi:hypothetical protein